MKEKPDEIEGNSEEDGFDDFEDAPQFQAQNDIQIDQRSSHEAS